MAETSDVAVLGIRIESSGIDEAKQRLDGLTASTVKAEKASHDFEFAQKKYNDSANATAMHGFLAKQGLDGLTASTVRAESATLKLAAAQRLQELSARVAKETSAKQSLDELAASSSKAATATLGLVAAQKSQGSAAQVAQPIKQGLDELAASTVKAEVATLALATAQKTQGSVVQTVLPAKQGLDGLAASTTKAEIATIGLAAAQKSQAGLATSAQRAYASLSTSSDRYLASLAREYNALGKTRGEVVSRDASLHKLSSTEAAHAITIGKAIDAYKIEEGAARDLARAQDAAAAAVARSLAVLEQRALLASKGAAAGQIEVLASKGATAAELERAKAALVTIDAAEKAAKATKGHGAALTEFSLKSNIAKRELITLFREAGRGDFTRLAGSFSLFAQASGLAAVSATAAGVSIIGLTAIIAATVAVVVIGTKEQKALQNAFLLTGNAAGQTAANIRELAESIQKTLASAGATIRGTEQTLLGLVASGKLTGAALTAAGAASEAFQKATGESAEKSNALFVGATRNISDFANKQNEQYHFLSAAEQRRIKELHDEGREQEALTLTFDRFTERLRPAANNIGSLEKAWNSAKEALSGYLDKLLKAGAPDTASSALSKAEARLAALQRAQDNLKSFGAVGQAIGAVTGAIGLGSGDKSAEIKNTQEEIAALKSSLHLTEQVAKAQGESNNRQAARHALDVEHDKYLTREVRLRNEIRNAQAKAAIADPSGQDPSTQKALAETIAGLRERFKPRGGNRGVLTEQDFVKIDVQKIQAQFRAMADGLRNFDAIASAEHQAGLVDEQDYYAQRAALVKADANIAIESLERQNAVYRAGIDSRRVNAKQAAEDEKQIVINSGKISSIRDKEQADLAVLGIESQRYLTSLAVGYLNARLQAEQYLSTLARQSKQTIALQPLGAQEAQRQSGRNQISNTYDDQKLAADNTKLLQERSGTFTRTEQQQYDARVAQIAEFKTKALAEWDSYYAQLIAAGNVWENGAHRALQNYIDQAGYTARNVEAVFTNGLKNMEDALVTFATTGKLSFKMLIDSFVADIARLVIQQELIKPIASYLNGVIGSGSSTTGGESSTASLIAKGVGLVGSFFGPSKGLSANEGDAIDEFVSGKRELGGPVGPNQTVQVNEKGRPELLAVAGKQYLMMGDQGGAVSPSADAAPPAPSWTINQTFVLQQPASKQTQTQVAAYATNGLRRGQRNQ